MMARWKIPKADADAAIRDFLNQPRAHCVNADAKTLRRAFELSDELHHDVYDAFLIALADASRQPPADTANATQTQRVLTPPP